LDPDLPIGNLTAKIIGVIVFILLAVGFVILAAADYECCGWRGKWKRGSMNLWKRDAG
jgi:hypothetical protein